MNTFNEIKKEYKKPVLIFCEPILPNNPKAITYKNYKLSNSERYNSLIQYYKKLGFTEEIEINNTLHNYLWNDDINTKCMRIGLYGLLE